MNIPKSPLRKLVKKYTNQIITREQYLDVRKDLLKKLSAQRTINQEDLDKFLSIQESAKPVTHNTLKNTYSISEWLIIGLGLLAATFLGYMLYS